VRTEVYLNNNLDMTQPNIPFKLRSLDLSADSAVAPSDNLPAEVAGSPASYFWKDMIHTGNYVHPAKNFSLAVDQDRLGRWADIGGKLLSGGVAVPINCDHSDAARDVVGYVKQFKLDGDRLLGLCQFIGDDAALMAARNLVSVGIDPDFTDGQGRLWGEAIVHLALTPVPVVPDQDQFVKMPDAENQVPNDEETALACTAQQFQKLQALVGDDVSADYCVSRIIEQWESAAETTEPSSVDLQAELAAARQEIFQLSSRVPPTMPAEVQTALAESAAAKFDLAVERGTVSPGVRDQLVALLVQSADAKPNLIALSRVSTSGGDRCLAMAVADALLDNEPVSLGERTGLQAMPRQIPGDESSPIDQLRSYMTKIASVSG
jgi:hypothetical protein